MNCRYVIKSVFLLLLNFISLKWRINSETSVKYLGSQKFCQILVSLDPSWNLKNQWNDPTNLRHFWSSKFCQIFKIKLRIDVKSIWLQRLKLVLSNWRKKSLRQQTLLWQPTFLSELGLSRSIINVNMWFSCQVWQKQK